MWRKSPDWEDGGASAWGSVAVRAHVTVGDLTWSWTTTFEFGV